jgi:hypothetical protein
MTDIGLGSGRNQPKSCGIRSGKVEEIGREQSLGLDSATILHKRYSTFGGRVALLLGFHNVIAAER